MRGSVQQRGAAMMWAMVLVIMAGSLSAVLLQRDQTMRQEASTDAQALAAVHAIEGGLATVRHALTRDPDYAGATFTIGACKVKATVVGSQQAGWRADLSAVPGGQRLHVQLAATAGLPEVVARR